MNRTADFKIIDALWDEYFSQPEEALRRKIREKIIILSMPFVHNIAKKLARRSTDPIEDIVQVGTVGLLKAVTNFIKSPDTSFKTFVSLYITGEIRHYLRDKMTIIKAPRSTYELFIRINKLTDEINTTGFIDTTEIELANKLNVPVKKVREVFEIERRKRILSLDMLLDYINKGGITVKETVPEDDYEFGASKFDTKILLNQALSKLDDELEQIIKLTFFAEETQVSIAKKMGLSQGQVSRRIKKALNLLFDIIEKEPELQTETEESGNPEDEE